MTLTEFKRAFGKAAKKGQWKLDASGQLRGPRNHCPLTFVAKTTPCFALDAIAILKMSRKNHAVICASADGALRREFSHRLRTELLRLAHVKEQP